MRAVSVLVALSLSTVLAARSSANDLGTTGPTPGALQEVVGEG